MSDKSKGLEVLIEIRDYLYLTKKVFNVDDLHKYTGLSKSKIYKLTGKGLIPTGSNKNLHQKFFCKEEIDKWLLGQMNSSEEDLEGEFNRSLLKNKKA